MSNSIVVKLKKGKNVFEVLAKPGTVEKYRNGKLGFDKVCMADAVFKNSKKGDLWTNNDLEKSFGTTDTNQILKEIVEKGEYQMTAAERKEKSEQKRRKVINYIHKYYVDPKTNRSHPLTRIENAFEQQKIRIDVDQSAERQAQQIARKIMEVLPIRKSVMEGILKVPNQHAGKIMGLIGKWATIQSQNWKSDGCEVSISVIPGDYDVMMKELSDKTQGGVEFFTGDELKNANKSEKETPKTNKKSKKKKKGRDRR